MAIQFRAASTLAYVTGSAETITKPTGTIDGDYMFMMIGDDAAFDTQMRPPTGWYEIPGADLGGSTSINIWYKEASSEPADYTVTSLSSGINGFVGIVTLYSDSGADIKVDAVATQLNSSATDRTFPSVTLSASGYLLCMAILSSNQASTSDGLMDERIDAGQSGIRGYAMTQAGLSAGATGTRTATGTSVTSFCVSLALIEGTPVNIYPRLRDLTQVLPTTDSDGTWTNGIPSSAEVGDFLVFHVSITVSRTYTTPDGWTLLESSNATDGILVYVKTCEPGDAGSTVSLAYSGGSLVLASAISAWYSPTGKNIVVDVSDLQTNSAAGTVDWPTVTTTTANTTLLLLFSEAGTVASQQTAGGHQWMQYDFGASSVRTGLYKEFVAAAGATGTRSLSWTVAVSRATVAVVIALAEVTPVFVATHRVYPSENYYTVVYDGTDVTPYVRLGSLEGVTEELAAQSLADDHPVSTPGKTDWRVALDGPLTKDLDDMFGKESLTSGTYRDLVITVGEVGGATTYTWEAGDEVGAFVTGYKVGPNVQFGEIPFKAEIGTSGAPVRGTA